MTSGTEERQRRETMSIRVTKEERALIKAKAERAGVTVGTYARDAMIGTYAPRRVRRPPAEKAELVRILGELGKLGSNVNQLAAKANIGLLRVLDPMALAQLQDDLDEMRDDLMRALGRQP